MKRSILEDVAAIVHPPPNPEAIDPPEAQDDAMADLWPDVEEARRQLVEDLAARWDAGGEDYDPLLDEIARARDEARAAQTRMRLLVAFGREVVRPRGYELGRLAQAAGMTFSGVRTFYKPADVERVRSLLDEPSAAATDR